MDKIPILLLAAGQSRRMGGADKLMQEIDGEPLLRRSASIAMTAGPVIAALPPAPHPRHGALAGLDIEIVEVPDAAEGMNASLRRAVAALPPQAPAAMVLLADLPDLTAQDLSHVLAAIDFSSNNLVWRGATEDGRPGHPVVFHCALFPELLALTGDGGAQSVAQAYKDRQMLVPLPGQNARTDLDTPEAWADWRAKRQ
ncbi:NTP transferase domain-containing protein [Ruegeria sp. PrR005]|uniref:Nucleotidyltransferase family protein n=1 Tax=Ruegeria sp. PrR005 TaxID=2706882 RepID=A0A6B2NKN3_9RHOB|nr:nucleotidyltransferase family protein [Ruegeria sp. PrR005]NDW43918.1 nucleotidyltransferase family protein [Ruegeria sp. PrR005]